MHFQLQTTRNLAGVLNLQASFFGETPFSEQKERKEDVGWETS